MTCNAPIDISPTDTKYKCSTRCSFTFNYPVASCTATILTDHISLTYNSSKKINYNLLEYGVVEIKIYSKPIHSFGGQPSDGEIIIIHKSTTNKMLMVCVPIIKSQLSTTSSNNLSELMETLQSNKRGVTITDFATLNDLVGKTKFYTYNASNFLGLDCSQNVNYVVYRPNDYSVPMTQNTFAILSSLIKGHTYQTVTAFDTKIVKPLLYINEQGPNISNDDQIYIDCQPINKSEETIEVNMSKSTPIFTGFFTNFSFNFDILKSNQFLQFILCFIFFILIMYISYYSIEVVNKIFAPIFHRHD